MPGVTVLNSYEACVDATWGWNVIGIALFITAGLMLIIGILLMICEQPEGILLMIGMMFCTIGGLNTQANSIPVYEQHYQVIIDDSCNMNDFFEKYELIEKQGEIYVVREITP